MAFGFDKAFNKFAQVGTSLNRSVNKAIGKEVFQDIRQIEKPREFAPYESFPEYSSPEPGQWPPLSGEAKTFMLEGNVISVPADLDACMQYRTYFSQAASYYTQRFKFKYKNCVQDFDTLIHYFPDLYNDGLIPMVHRAYSLLLPFGVFTADVHEFASRHMDTYQRALNSYATMTAVEESKNQQAANLGNQVGGAVRMQGGGFGFKGAMKGAAQAEAFNLGMGLLGKYVANQSKMTQEEKAKVFAAFDSELFFEEVYSDYSNTFLSFVQTLADNGIINGITTQIGAEFETIFRNLQNPMFPREKLAPAFAKIISSNPFVPACFELLRQSFGQTQEVALITDYFLE